VPLLEFTIEPKLIHQIAGAAHAQISPLLKFRDPHIVQHRIASAQSYLAQPNLSIVEICLLVGFQNQSHFTRIFRQHTGVTPNVYRDRL
jgi:AraC-like DNA-binding protein